MRWLRVGVFVALLPCTVVQNNASNMIIKVVTFLYFQHYRLIMIQTYGTSFPLQHRTLRIRACIALYIQHAPVSFVQVVDRPAKTRTCFSIPKYQ